ncbi:EscD/YscD/HrpQ family type III secretion system inner membrane ring protein [Parashewanella spongiae]|uniref:EscD/YscD/HrpQ family type III secretion system inner membrane ring protein n=1 Tax=Parashewanella spongiae TaxID=342950 RepID=A0A3A6U497_9GAMM|nr:type III secretion system inner membrane ring subunit SctD [Parashewanella spongiae]MCL1076968.1 type III secretion system inner membrane ring subunit SctD [Parashewanella spongiae]RJY18916.1 EscD/YscD/HrpQ family type III secretion system inner membrane ring protein [Parashewanella spongiae]
MPSTFKILWLNGPLKGRQLVLPLGSFTIGSDGDVLAVLDNSEQLEFDISEDKVSLVNETEVWVNGEKQESIDEIAHGEVIEIEGIAFILGDADTEIEAKSIPRKKMPKKSASHWALFIISVFSTLLIVLLLIDPVHAPQHSVTPKQWVDQRLTVNELDGIKSIWSENGVVTFNGFCENSQKLNQFVDEVKKHGILFVMHAECTDQLVTDVKQVLNQNGFQNVSVEQNIIPGSVTISGAIQAGERWNKAITVLKTIPSLVSWHVINESGVQIKPLIDALRKQNLIESLMITQLDDSIVITGEVDQNSEARVIKIAHNIKKIQQNGIKIVFQNIPVRHEVNRILTSPVVSFGGNSELPFIELENGYRLSIGNELDNGYVIEFIDIKGVDLSKNGQIIHIPLLF